MSAIPIPMHARDPRDRKYPERLSLSYVVSCIIHVLLALLLFSIASSSSNEGASESTRGGEIVTLEHRAVVAAQPAPAPSTVPPIPHAPVIAPTPRHAPAPQTAAQRQPQNVHELAKIVPHASPNPKPVPQSSAQPNPQPTQQVFEPKPEQAVPAVPISVPTAQAIAVTIKVPPTAVPSPAPTAAPTSAPTAKPQPSAPPTRSPNTPAPASTAAAIKPATLARATAAPASPAPPGPIASVAPAKNAGVPSPGPTNGPARANNRGTSPTPGPKGTGAPGPQAGTKASSHPGPSRPVTVRPTAAPASPAPSGGSSAGNALSAKLRALLLPTGPGVPPKQTHIAPGVGAIPTDLEPTPPPEIVAKTIYIYESGTNTTERKVKMWVTSMHKEGPLTICTGWLLREPLPAPFNIAGGRQHAPAPIIQENATFICPAHYLRPYKP